MEKAKQQLKNIKLLITIGFILIVFCTLTSVGLLDIDTIYNSFKKTNENDQSKITGNASADKTPNNDNNKDDIKDPENKPKEFIKSQFAIDKMSITTTDDFKSSIVYNSFTKSTLVVVSDYVDYILDDYSSSYNTYIFIDQLASPIYLAETKNMHLSQAYPTIDGYILIMTSDKISKIVILDQNNKISTIDISISSSSTLNLTSYGYCLISSSSDSLQIVNLDCDYKLANTIKIPMPNKITITSSILFNDTIYLLFKNLYECGIMTIKGNSLIEYSTYPDSIAIIPKYENGFEFDIITYQNNLLERSKVSGDKIKEIKKTDLIAECKIATIDYPNIYIEKDSKYYKVDYNNYELTELEISSEYKIIKGNEDYLMIQKDCIAIYSVKQNKILIDDIASNNTIMFASDRIYTVQKTNNNDIIYTNIELVNNR